MNKYVPNSSIKDLNCKIFFIVVKTCVKTSYTFLDELTAEEKNWHIIFFKLATVVEGDQKVPFSIATTPRCRGGHYSFPWIAPLYSCYILYIAER